MGRYTTIPVAGAESMNCKQSRLFRGTWAWVRKRCCAASKITQPTILEPTLHPNHLHSRFNRSAPPYHLSSLLPLARPPHQHQSIPPSKSPLTIMTPYLETFLGRVFYPQRSRESNSHLGPSLHLSSFHSFSQSHLRLAFLPQLSRC